jgi:protein involved in polysaccharide export with SLBB domain
MKSSRICRIAVLLGIVCFFCHRAAPAAAQQSSIALYTLVVQQSAATPRFQPEKAPPPVNFEDALETPIDPATYRLGPGDELMVSVIARTPVDYQAPVSPDGAIFLPTVGQLMVRGKTLAQVERDVDQAIGRVRKDFRSSVQLTRLHKIKVEVLGQVKEPGTYVLGPLARVSEAVSRAGGPTPIASWRHVRVRRGQTTLGEVDLERIWKLGEADANLALETGDEIYVPRAYALVNVSGEVNVPGDYEVDPGESVKEVVRRAGGVTSTGAETAVHVERPGTNDHRVLVAADLTRNPPPVALQDRDRIVVPTLASVQGRIRIVGAVKGQGSNWTGDVLPKEGVQGVNSGLYLLRDGDRVKDVIENVGGLTSKADRLKAQVERPDGQGGKQVLPVNLYRLLVENDMGQNLELHNGDTLVVPTLIDQVYVLGQVLQAGPYQYEEGRTVLDYISAARGTGNRARKDSTTLVRGEPPHGQTIKVPLKDMYAGKVDPRSIVVKPGDIIIIPEAPIKSWQDIAGLVWTARSLFTGLFLFQ